MHAWVPGVGFKKSARKTNLKLPKSHYYTEVLYFSARYAKQEYSSAMYLRVCMHWNIVRQCTKKFESKPKTRTEKKVEAEKL